MPACGEDVGEQDEVCFVLCSGGEGQAVEICVWDAEVLGLAALVGAHCNVAVGAACETTVLVSFLGGERVGRGGSTD